MKKEVRADLLVMSIATLLVGGVLVFASVYFGTLLSDNWKLKNDGADPTYYTMITNNYIDIFQVLGGILFTLGSIISLYLYYLIKQEIS